MKLNTKTDTITKMIWDELDFFEGLKPNGGYPDRLIFENKQQFLDYCNNIWASVSNFSSYRAKYEKEYLDNKPKLRWFLNKDGKLIEMLKEGVHCG